MSVGKMSEVLDKFKMNVVFILRGTSTVYYHGHVYTCFINIQENSEGNHYQLVDVEFNSRWALP